MYSHSAIFTNDVARVLWGVSLYTGSTRLAEMAGKIGFDVVWIEMEHGPTDYQTAENICLAAEAGGAVPAVRLPNGRRDHVLRALEIGARIVVIPMVDTAEEAAEIVQHGKYPPLGMRGFNNRTRGTGYGLNWLSDALATVNADTHLFVQIETRRAVENLDAIFKVEGLTGILVGPCDLSMSYGMNGQLDSPILISKVVDILRRARLAGRRGAIFVPPGPMLDAVMEVGCDLVICGGDVANLATTWIELLKSMQQKATPK
jgi:2-keto-3-deoxy-L-rhamnonate aldolase RhmA